MRLRAPCQPARSSEPRRRRRCPPAWASHDAMMRMSRQRNTSPSHPKSEDSRPPCGAAKSGAPPGRTTPWQQLRHRMCVSAASQLPSSASQLSAQSPASCVGAASWAAHCSQSQRASSTAAASHTGKGGGGASAGTASGASGAPGDVGQSMYRRTTSTSAVPIATSGQRRELSLVTMLGSSGALHSRPCSARASSWIVVSHALRS